jgi:DNA-binding response OmpR family regulator
MSLGGTWPRRWGTQVTDRILVVDDVAVMRVLLRRVLVSGGYSVDVVASLAEARALDPGSYAGVLIDDHLGKERGTELIQELRAADPGAARRCLLVTGDGAASRPDGVAVLAKPFQPAELLDAVRSLCRPGSATGPGGRTGPDPGEACLASLPSEGTRPAAAGPAAWQLLAIIRRLRERERRDLADFLHDGPIQELTAATLEMHLLRGSGADQRVDAALRQLSLAAAALHRLMDEDRAFSQPAASLAGSLQRRTAWLLAEPLVVEDDDASSALPPSELAAVTDMVEMMLLGTVPAGRPLRARILVHAGSPTDPRVPPGTMDQGTTPPGTTSGTGNPVVGPGTDHLGARARNGGRLIRLGLILTPAAQDDQPIGDPEPARAALRELAAALQATTDAHFGVRCWQIGLALWMGARSGSLTSSSYGRS